MSASAVASTCERRSSTFTSRRAAPSDGPRPPAPRASFWRHPVAARAPRRPGGPRNCARRGCLRPAYPARRPLNIPQCRAWRLPFLLAAMLGALAQPSLGQPEGKKGEAKKEEPKGRKYALVVGVRHYKKDELRSLKYADKDAAALAAALRAA